MYILKSIGTVTGPKNLSIGLNNNTTWTFPINFSLKLLSSETTVEVQLGISFELNLTAIDEFSQPTMVMYQAYVQDMNKSDDIDPAYVYLSDSEKNIMV